MNVLPGLPVGISCVLKALHRVLKIQIVLFFSTFFQFLNAIKNLYLEPDKVDVIFWHYMLPVLFQSLSLLSAVCLSLYLEHPVFRIRDILLRYGSDF
jgi:hypothetical protein